LLNSEV